MKKEATPKCKGLKRNTSDEKEVISKNRKYGTNNSPKLALLN
jgi:hypothetical protein